MSKQGWRWPVAELGWPTRLGLAVVVAAVDCAALLAGWWWATAAVAFVVALACAGRGLALSVLAAALVAWAGLMAWEAGGRLTGIANLTGALAFGSVGAGWLVLVVACVVGAALSLAGLWFGSALRRMAVGLRAP